MQAPALVTLQSFGCTNCHFLNTRPVCNILEIVKCEKWAQVAGDSIDFSSGSVSPTVSN